MRSIILLLDSLRASFHWSLQER